MQAGRKAGRQAYAGGYVGMQVGWHVCMHACMHLKTDTLFTFIYIRRCVYVFVVSKGRICQDT